MDQVCHSDFKTWVGSDQQLLLVTILPNSILLEKCDVRSSFKLSVHSEKETSTKNDESNGAETDELKTNELKPVEKTAIFLFLFFAVLFILLCFFYKPPILNYNKFNESYKDAILNNDLEMVKLLFKEGKDPSWNNDFAIKYSAERCQIEIVKFLVETKKINVMVEDFYALRRAIFTSCLPVVEILLDQLPTIYTDIDVSWVMVHAAANGHEEIVKRILKYTSITPDYIYMAYMLANKFDHRNVLNILSKDTRFNLANFIVVFSADIPEKMQDFVGNAKF